MTKKTAKIFKKSAVNVSSEKIMQIIIDISFFFITFAEIMDTAKIRIKDIAERAGVSVGTVDRVLHERPNVSPKALDKVKKALEEMDYKPNRYASALAYNKSYTFFMVLPKHESEAYWEEIEIGATEATERFRDFRVSKTVMYYNRFDINTFSQTMTEVLKQQPDGVVVVPSQLDITRKYTDIMHTQEIPFVLLDSYMPDLRPLAFFGQDSFASGYYAARMMMLFTPNEKEIMLMKQMHNGNVASKQQENRETGFRHYMHDHFPNVKIHEVYLLRSNRRNIQIMGYDMVPKNAECVRQGSISCLIAQHAFMQGYACIDTLFNAIILKKKVDSVNYMPIELLSKENIDFYRRENIG